MSVKKPPKKVLTIRLSPKAYRLLQQRAKDDGRSLSGTIEYLVLVFGTRPSVWVKQIVGPLRLGVL